MLRAALSRGQVSKVLTASVRYIYHTKPIGTTLNSSIDESELKKFSSQSDQWWCDVEGPFAALHSLNKVRVPLIRQALLELSLPVPAMDFPGRPLKGFRILDVGCGGGILAEALARQGASVLGIDAASENIQAALRHRENDPRLSSRLSYEAVTAETLLDRLEASSVGGSSAGHALTAFDAVIASEVVEHVRDPASFVNTCAGLVRVRACGGEGKGQFVCRVCYVAFLMKWPLCPTLWTAAWWIACVDDNQSHGSVVCRGDPGC